jgi:hypothetical protein
VGRSADGASFGLQKKIRHIENAAQKDKDQPIEFFRGFDVSFAKFTVPDDGHKEPPLGN